MDDERREVESGAALADRINTRLSWAGFLSNGVGAVTVVLFVSVLLPSEVDSGDFGPLALRSLPVFAVYMMIALPLGRYLIQRRPYMKVERWLRAERPATEDERELVLRYPLNWALGSSAFWAIAAILFSLLNVSTSFAAVLSIAVTIALGALTACALQYLLVERILRPVTARALAESAPPRLAAPGVAARLTMAWTLATGVPLVGMVALAVAHFAGADLDQDAVVGGTLFLAALALVVGLATMLVAARAVADPVGGVRRALEAVEGGEFEARVTVDDGSEVGLLQAGFNRMAVGLAERERLREMFGTYLDREVAEHILKEGTALEGEEVQVTVMFIDIRDFTGFAERASAQEVVAALNHLFDAMVPVIHAHAGHVDKFVGDGLLAVFGAPRRQADHADQALSAAVEITQSVEGLGDRLQIGVGLNTGAVVAGNVGGGGRFDFSVIGDAVNIAARVESATRQTGDPILIAAETMRALRDSRFPLEERPGIELKGKREPVDLYAPSTVTAPSSPSA
jgi:adenylate cyclase